MGNNEQNQLAKKIKGKKIVQIVQWHFLKE